jgi:hypothetical protein
MRLASIAASCASSVAPANTPFASDSAKIAAAVNIARQPSGLQQRLTRAPFQSDSHLKA